MGNNRFPQIFSELIEQKPNLSNYKLAKDLGVSQTTIKNWRDGISNPDTAKIVDIANYFGVSIDYLILGKVLSSSFNDLISEDKSIMNARPPMNEQPIAYTIENGELKQISITDEERRLVALRTIDELTQKIQEVVRDELKSN